MMYQITLLNCSQLALHAAQHLTALLHVLKSEPHNNLQLISSVVPPAMAPAARLHSSKEPQPWASLCFHGFETRHALTAASYITTSTKQHFRVC
jgi:hypothetical protein